MRQRLLPPYYAVTVVIFHACCFRRDFLFCYYAVYLPILIVVCRHYARLMSAAAPYERAGVLQQDAARSAFMLTITFTRVDADALP